MKTIKNEKDYRTSLRIISNVTKNPNYTPNAVRSLLYRLDLSEKAFALLLNVSPVTVRFWVTGAARPCGSARRLMQLFDVCPELIDEIIGE